MTLVFAYAATLDAAALEAAGRGASMRVHGHVGARFSFHATALLLDRALGFERCSRAGGTPCLSVAPGHAVEGALFEANDEALAALDARPHAAPREMVHAILPDGRVVEAQLHDLSPDSRGGHAPPTDDLDRAARNEPPTPAIPWIFVYGTLRAGLPNAHLLDGLPRQPATCPGLLHDCGAYPAMTLGEGRVAGELLPLDPARLSLLDALEEALPFGAPGGTYRRTVLTAALPDGTPRRAQLYVMDDVAAHPSIPSGNWQDAGDRRAAWLARRTP